MKVESGKHPGKFKIKEQKNGWATVDFYTNVVEKTRETEDDAGTIYEYDRYIVQFADRSNLADLIEKDYESWLKVAEKQYAEKWDKEQEEKRKQAYKEEADPLFFKAQLDEKSSNDWKDKVEEIRNKYPYFKEL